jgi:hypothetical protein
MNLNATPLAPIKVATPNGSGGITPVIRQAGLSGRLNAGWATPLSTAYPLNTRLVTKGNSTPSSQVLSNGVNQTGDPRNEFSGLWALSALTKNVQLGGGPVIGGNNITLGDSNLTPLLLILGTGMILLLIWK